MRIHLALGDSHNFGRHVTMRGARVEKPRPVLWEWLFLCAESPLRVLLGDAFRFLPSLRFYGEDEVSRVVLSPLLLRSRAELPSIVGKSLALFSWFGVTDLHWENLVLGADAKGRVVFGPLDIEMIFGDFDSPTKTKLLPDADPEYADISRHSCGVRRIFPFLGKPIRGEDLAAIAHAYARTLIDLDARARDIAAVFSEVPKLASTPIRVLLRGTAEYVEHARVARPIWPPLLPAEEEQLARGDIPYFFRLYGRAGIHYWKNRELTEMGTLPARGDVPRLEPLLRVTGPRAFQSAAHAKLHVEGLFTVLGAFDDASPLGLSGRYEDGDLAVTFTRRAIKASYRGEELETGRNLSAFVGSAYLACRCGEARSVFVPQKTRCTL